MSTAPNVEPFLAALSLGQALQQLLASQPELLPRLRRLASCELALMVPDIAPVTTQDYETLSDEGSEALRTLVDVLDVHAA